MSALEEILTEQELTVLEMKWNDPHKSWQPGNWRSQYEDLYADFRKLLTDLRDCMDEQKQSKQPPESEGKR